MKMQARLFQFDAFTSRRFAGNPAAVMVLDEYPEGGVLQALLPRTISRKQPSLFLMTATT
jgi:hypothetical protein